MPSEPGTPTLDQLRVFLTVVEVGSFAGAARQLGRATSVISYSIANLEAQLGVSLFDRESTRKPQLTEAGRTVLAEARTVFNGVDALRAKVKGLVAGPNCDSGSLLNGRSDSFPEVNRPNTLNASCADGTWSGYLAKRAIEHLTVSTTDGSNLAAGKTVKLEATVYAYSLVQDKLDLYYTASVESPSWTFIGTYTPSRSGLNTLSVTYTLPTGGVQAVRANFRFVDSSNTHSPASICSSGNYDDHDDLIFTVQPSAAFR
jgi:leucyl aminopeptidase